MNESMNKGIHATRKGNAHVTLDGGHCLKKEMKNKTKHGRM